jgi:hypothetical protein
MKKWPIGSIVTPLLLALSCGQNSPSGKLETKIASAPSLPAPLSEYQPPHRNPEFTTATTQLGALYVTEGLFDSEASQKPWSSWWYPVKDTSLFESADHQLSPLEKYDLYMQRSRLHPSVHSALFERQNIYDPNADSWEGHCDAWALAAITEPEPTHAIDVNGIHFSVGDLKALLIKTYEVPTGLIQFGQRYNGTSESIYEDIYPDQFHRILQVQLFEKHKAFIMDKDASIAVWNTPVWKSYSKIVVDGDPHVLHVTTWLVGADPHVEDLNFVGTREVDFEYHYDLMGNRETDGRFLVLFGKWTGDSVQDHPDFLTLAPDQVKTKSRNTQIDSEEVGRLFQHLPNI